MRHIRVFFKAEYKVCFVFFSSTEYNRTAIFTGFNFSHFRNMYTLLGPTCGRLVHATLDARPKTRPPQGGVRFFGRSATIFPVDTRQDFSTYRPGARKTTAQAELGAERRTSPVLILKIQTLTIHFVLCWNFHETNFVLCFEVHSSKSHTCTSTSTLKNFW